MGSVALDFEPPLVGRVKELETLVRLLDEATAGRGRFILMAGEAGIGKTRLVQELKRIAESRGFQVLVGCSFYESMTPYMPFLEALRSGGLEHLFAEEAPRLEGLYLVANNGLLVREVIREGTRLDPDIFASMLATVGDFVGESLSLLKGPMGRDTLSRLDYGRHSIVMERGRSAGLVAILAGRGNEFLIRDLQETLERVHDEYGDVLQDWDGDDEGVKGAGALLVPLLEKYDGVRYGQEDPKVRRGLLFQNVSLGLERGAKVRPMVLCLEDLQWADPSTLAVVHYVARNNRNCGLLLVGTYRPEDLVTGSGRPHPLSEAIQRLERGNLCEKIDLGRPPEEGTAELLSSLFGESTLRDDFVHRVHEETEGNPFFVIELVKLMVEEGRLQRDEGAWTVPAGVGDIDIPDKVHDVVVRRLDRLEERQREALDVASVAGEEFPAELLSSVLGKDRVLLLRTLGPLEQKHRLVRRQDGRYRFDHVKIKEVLYGELSPSLRQAYHAAIGDALAKRNRDSLDVAAGDIAFHYLRSGEPHRALPYLERAATAASRQYANAEAIRFHSEALALVQDDKEKRREILEALASVFELTGNYEPALQAYQDALELAEPPRTAELLTRIGRVHERRGEFDEALRMCVEALRRTEGTGGKEEVFASFQIGTIHLRKGVYDQSLDYYSRSLAISEAIGDEPGIANALEGIGVVYYRQADYDRSLEYNNRSLAIREKIGEERGVATTLINIGSAWWYKGDSRRALEYYERSLAMSEKMGYEEGTGAALCNMGVAYHTRGDDDRSLECYERSLAIFERIGSEMNAAVLLGNLGVVHGDLGDYGRALDQAGRSLAICEKIGFREQAARSLQSIGFLYAVTGDYDRALTRFAQALQASEEIGDKVTLAATLTYIGRVHSDRGEYDSALACHNRALAISEGVTDPETAGVPLTGIAWVYSCRGEEDRALEYLGRAIELQEQIGNSHGAVDTVIAMGSAYVSKGAYGVAVDHARRAVSRAQQLRNFEMMAKSELLLAEALTRAGELQEAWSSCNGLLALRGHQGLTPFLGALQMTAAMIHRNRQMWSEAIQGFEDSLRICRELGRRFDEGRSQHEFGLMWGLKGDYEKEREHLSRAMEIFNRIGAKKELARAKGAMSKLRDESGPVFDGHQEEDRSAGG